MNVKTFLSEISSPNTVSTVHLTIFFPKAVPPKDDRTSFGQEEELALRLKPNFSVFDWVEVISAIWDHPTCGLERARLEIGSRNDADATTKADAPCCVKTAVHPSSSLKLSLEHDSSCVLSEVL